MDIEQSIVPSYKGVSESEWVEWKDFIREEFLVKDYTLDQVTKILQQRNPYVTTPKLRTRLKQWGFQKNLSREEWQYVNHSIEKRKAQDKDSVIILSGMRLSQEEMKKRRERHKVVSLFNKWIPPPSPEPPNEGVPLYICTPRATSPDASMIVEWPRNLPWLQFSETILPQLMSNLRLLPEKETETTITKYTSQHTRPRKKRRHDVALVWTAFEKLVRRSMEIIIGSEELIGTLLLNKSVDRIAGYLDQVIPVAYAGENLNRAIVLCSGARSETQGEVLKILLFLTSNHLIMDFDHENSKRYIDEARALVDIFHLSGLGEPSILTKMVTISFSNPTMQAVLDLLYEAAVATETVDLILKLLEADQRIDVNQPVTHIWWEPLFHLPPTKWSALEYSLLRGSPKLASHMILAKANVNLLSKDGLYPLVLATLASPEDVAVQLVQLLLQNGAIMDDCKGSTVLRVAVIKGRFQLITLFHESGANLGSILPTQMADKSFPIVWIEMNTGNLPKSFGDHLDYLSCIGLAAAFSTHCSRPLYKGPPSGRNNGDQDEALRLVKHVLSLAGPEFDLDGKLKSDAMIYAAMRGYTEVVLFLYRSGARVNSKNGCLCPVYAAVNWGQVECCQLLLELEGTARAEYRSWERAGANTSTLLPPLHAAVSYNSRELVDLLIHNGVDVDFPFKVNCSVEELVSNPLWQYGPWPFSNYMADDHSGKPPEFVSPLSLATAIGSWDVALLLVESGATFTDDDLFRAVNAGQHQFISKILELKAGRGQITEDGENMLQASIRHGHESIALLLLESGAAIGSEALGLALQYGLHNIAIKLVDMGFNLPRTELIWAFRLPNELKLRSLLQSQLSDNFIGEHSPDGRSFLENAILSGDIGVMKFALSLNSFAYDSGALCAAVLTAIQLPLIDMDGILIELFRRRGLPSQQNSRCNHILEGTALSIAAYHERMDIIIQFRNCGGYETDVAVPPKQSAWTWDKGVQCFWTETGRHIFLDDLRARNMIDISIIPLVDFCVGFPTSEEWNSWHDSDRWLTSPLTLAIKSGNETIIQELLDLGCRADVHSLNSAIYCNISFDLVRRLIEGCTDINGSKIVGMVVLSPPVHTAALLGSSDLVESLLKNGADPNAGLWQGREAMLCKLIRHKRVDLVDTFLQYGMDVRSTPRTRGFEHTALQTASRVGHLGIMRHLLEHGADPNAHRALWYGYTAIEAAAHYGRLDAVQLLLDSGVLTDGRGQVQYILAVHRAKQAGHSAVAHLLRSHREWAADDWEILTELNRLNYSLDFTVVVHHRAHTTEEVTEILDHINNFEEGLYRPDVVDIGDRIRLRKKGHQPVEYPPNSAIRPRLPLAVYPSTVPVDDSEGLAGNSEAQLAASVIPDHSAALNDPLLEEQSDLLDNFSLLGGSITGDFEASDIVSDRQICFETEETLRDIHLGPRDEAIDDKERSQQILEDMLGEREAPVETIEWKW
ncbi:ankyrin [Hypoxylon sp. EC38]|nr:ankyrin [Hypoxylon sp. EC38]